MSISLFIGLRMLRKSKIKKVSKPIQTLNIISISVSFFVMVLSLAIAFGFRKELLKKISDISGAIVINNSNNLIDVIEKPIKKFSKEIKDLKKINEIISINSYAITPVLLKNDKITHGLILKGVDSDYDSSIMKKYLLKGNFLKLNDTAEKYQIILSKKVSDILKVDVDDKVLAFFAGEHVKVRKFTVCGIYETMVEELDRMYAYASLKIVQNINNWNANEVNGYEIRIKDFEKSDKIAKEVFKIIYPSSLKNNFLYVQTLKELYPSIFEWISLFKVNAYTILVLLFLVCSFNVISGLIVLIIERVNMIGVLKSFGCSNYDIKKIFLYNGLFYASFGLIIGNLFYFIVSFLQNEFKIIKLNKTMYYLTHVPLEINLLTLFLINVIFIILILGSMLLPVAYINKIEPSKSIKFN